MLPTHFMNLGRNRPAPARERLQVGTKLRSWMVLALAGAAAAAVSACEVVDTKPSTVKQDTSAAPAVVPESGRGTLAPDSAGVAAATPGMPATPVTPAESLRAGVADDSGVVRIYPPEPRRGG